MKRVKKRWDIEFPQKKRTAQNLVDNARQFEKESLGPGVGANIQPKKEHRLDYWNEDKTGKNWWWWTK